MASILLDTRLPKEANDAIALGTQNLSDGIEIPLSKKARESIVYRKLEAISSMISDTQHGSEWMEQFMTHAKLGIVDGSESINEEDGLILTFIGKPEEEVAVDGRSNTIYRGEQIEEQEELLDQQMPRYLQYNFYLKSALVTDGPTRRAELAQTHEQRRLKEQGDMFSTITEAFQSAMDGKEGGVSQEMVDAAVAKALKERK